VPSPGRSNRGNLTVVGGDRAEEETDEEDENRRSMVAAHHRPQSAEQSGPLVTSHTPGASPNGKYYVLDSTPIYSEAVKERERIR